MQEAFNRLAAQQRELVGSHTGLRVAVNTGELVVKSGSDAIGDPVNVAFRLQDQAQTGDVVISGETRSLVVNQLSLELLGSIGLRGRSREVKAYRVVSLEPPREATLAPFVGRATELARMEAIFQQAVASPAARLAVLLGSPGLGKSRLLAEFAHRRAGDASVLAASCDAAGGGTFAPLAEAIRKLLELEAGATLEELQARAEEWIPAADAERSRIARGIAGLLAGAPGLPEETFFVVRRFFAGLGASRPVVLIIDDLQWAEPLLFDLIQHLVQWGHDIPLLLLVGARPELRERHPAFAYSGALLAELIALEGLDAGAATRLAAGVLGADDLPAAAAARVLTTSEGNPLFISELVRMLVAEGALVREGDRWAVGTTLNSVAMPPTVHALLAARIEKLEAFDRAILERAAVIGRQFSRSAVAALFSGDLSTLDTRLEALQSAELIERGSGWMLGEPVLRFHHVLIRDAAYRRMLKGKRAELHERLADWIETRVGSAPDQDEIIGRHLEDAHQLLGELGPIDAHGQHLGERAASRLAAAGRRALEADDLPLAAGLLGRALDRLPADDPERASLAIDWCEALLSEGDVSTAQLAITELARWIEGSERLTAWHACLTGHHTVLTAPRELAATVSAVAAAAEALVALEDSTGEAKAHYVQALALSRQGQVGACEAALDRALAAARKAGDRRQANTVLAIAPVAALWGPGPVTRASGRCLDVVRVLRITKGAPAVEAVALMCQGVLEALRGRSEAAQRMIASGRDMVEELGISQRLYEADAYAGFVALIEGQLPRAEEKLRRAYDGLKELGLRIDAARAAALLARSLLDQDRIDEAIEASQHSEELAGDDLKAAIAWRSVRAQALARQGEHEAAITLARQAVEIAAATDALLDHADARHALEAALRAAGQEDEAAAEATQTRRLWQEKGAELLIDSLPASTGQTPPQTPPPSGGTAKPQPRSSEHHFPPNVISRLMDRYTVAINAKDFAAARALLTDDLTEVHHPTNTQYGPEGNIASLEAVFRNDGAYLRVPGIATLGEHLYLARCQVGANGNSSARFDVGAFEHEFVHVVQSDARGLVCHSELFAGDKLGDANARLWELYVESLSQGPERERAARIASWAATCHAMIDADRFCSHFADDIQAFDRRTTGYGQRSGKAEVSEPTLTMIKELTDNFHARTDDIYAWNLDGMLIHNTTTGIEIQSGGSFERLVWHLCIFDQDGRIGIWEQFETHHADAAVARFEELTSRAVQNSTASSSVSELQKFRPNAASRNIESYTAAVNARNEAAAKALIREDAMQTHHPTHTVYGREDMYHSLEKHMRNNGAFVRQQPLATLGEHLVLARFEAAAEGGTSKRFDVGAYEHHFIYLGQTDETGLGMHSELFASDKLAEALQRMYHLHAESLPSGPEQNRAQGIAALLEVVRAGLWDEQRLQQMDEGLADDLAWVDHRTVGSGRLSGAAEVMVAVRTLILELSEEYQCQIPELLRLSTQGYLFLQHNTGKDRSSGGAYERRIWELMLFNDNGKLSRWERFDEDKAAEALARFEELTGEHIPDPPSASAAAEQAAANSDVTSSRIVASNAATAMVAQVESRVEARDWPGLRALLRDDYRCVERGVGTDMSADKTVESFQYAFRSVDPYWENEMLASLGETLCLSRRRTGARRTAGKRFDVADYESVGYQLNEVDEQGLLRYSEVFAENRLGPAMSRLYERYYAALATTGQAPTGKFAVVWTQGFCSNEPVSQADSDAMFTTCASDMVAVDHRHVGFGTLRSRDEVKQAVHTLAFELSTRYAGAIREVACLSPQGFLALHQSKGTDRASGGEWAREVWELFIINDDGYLSHWERFDPEQQFEQALARFAELTGQTVPGPQASSVGAGQPDASSDVVSSRIVASNAAADLVARAEVYLAASDWPVLRALFSDDFSVLEHPTGATMGADQIVETFRLLSRSEAPYWRNEALAALGPSLFLSRRRTGARRTASKRVDFGAHELVGLQLYQTDDQGLLCYSEVFAENKLAAAIARLYELYYQALAELGQAPEAGFWVKWMRAYGTGEPISEADSEEVFTTTIASDMVAIDHRHVGFGTLRGRDEVMQAVHTLAFELSTRYTGAVRDVAGLCPHAVLLLHHSIGADRSTGGEWEREVWELFVINDDGYMRLWERFDPEQQFEQALARFKELTDTGGADSTTDRPDKAPSALDGFIPLPDCFANRASALTEPSYRYWNSQNAEAFRTEVLTEDFRRLDHRRLVGHLEIGREDWLAFTSQLWSMPFAHAHQRDLATRGENLVLRYLRIEVSGGDVGDSIIEQIDIVVVDPASGRARFQVCYDLEDIDKAYAELDARYAAENPPPSATRDWLDKFLSAFAAQDWPTMGACLADNFSQHDHRQDSVLGTLHGPQEFVAAQKAMVELVPDAVFRLNHFLQGSQGAYFTGLRSGSREGSDYEQQINVLFELDDQGCAIRFDVYDGDSAIDSPRWGELGIRPAMSRGETKPEMAAED